MSKWIARFVASCGGIGFSRYAPGTVASVCAAVIFYWIRFFCTTPVLVVCTSALCVVGFFAIQNTLTRDEQDPAWIVIDEWIAVWSMLVCLPHVWWIFLCGVCVFRLLDIAKPWPVSAAELLPGAWGVMADDLVAAALTAIFLCCVVIPVIL